MIRDTTCPHCGRLNENHAGANTEHEPSSGDVSLCWKCRGIGIYTDAGVRLPTPEEDERIRSHPEVRAVFGAMAESYTPSEAIELHRGGST